MRGRKSDRFESPYSEEEERELAELIAECQHDPLAYAMMSYPWGDESKGLGHFDGPKHFQKVVMNTVSNHLSNPETRFTPLKFAVKSGKGIGKTALISMLIDWGMSTCIDTKLRVTANTEEQLRLIVWTELLKWRRMALNRHWFNMSATSLTSAIPDHSGTWKANAVTWSERNLEAFAGFHNYGKRLIAIVDEGSGIADGVFDNMEGFLTDANTELLVFVFGNPTKRYGRFFEIFEGPNSHKNDWYKLTIDTRDVEGVNQAQNDSLINEYGIDSDIVKVTVLGEFPSTSFEQFFSSELVDRALERTSSLEEYQHDHPVIIGVDAAHTNDDIAIVARCGNWSKVLECFKKDSEETDRVTYEKAMYWDDELKADAVFVDLAYGTGIKTLADDDKRYHWQLIAFGGKSTSKRYKNKRAQMAGLYKDWMKDGGCLNGDKELARETKMPERRMSRDSKILVESKEDMASRLKKLYRSPGRLDGIMLTFARPVAKKRDTEDSREAKEQLAIEQAFTKGVTQNYTNGNPRGLGLPDPRKGFSRG